MAVQKTDLTAETILNALAEHSEQLYALGARKLGLFGSFVRGEQTPESDIDILVTMATPDYFAFTDVLFYLEDLFQRKVDLVPEKRLRDELRPYIMNEVIYVERIQALPE
ncbi:MAG TPA: nucleotidyltransferase family protein [Phototrophicaceae bacterium]|nr:nucleotidyltransferase family protein [Phototrophicaceae bacterium]